MHKTVSRGYQLVAVLFLVRLGLHSVLGIKGNSQSGPADDLHRRDTEDAIDILSSYIARQPPSDGRRYVRDCQHVKYGNVTHSLHPSHGGLSRDITLPIAETKLIITQVGNATKRRVKGHVTYVNNPLYTVSVLEPGHQGACRNGSADRATVQDSAEQKDCLVAINAGYFNVENGACYGNVVSDGRLVQDSAIQNAHFGILKNGSLFFGYVGESISPETDFAQLVGGVIWLVRDGENYVNESIRLECEKAETAGTLQFFAEALSARTAVGTDEDGHVVIVQVDGKTFSNGLNLWEFAEILQGLGMVNAVNLDSGGSVTFVQNGTLSNYPSDYCNRDDHLFRCARKVSTILCVQKPDCRPGNCSGHGDCVLGRCVCMGYWSGDACDLLTCPDDCNNNGVCKPEGCACDKGWKGPNCKSPCPVGRYGVNCSAMCRCQNEAACSPLDGSCQCEPGYTGILCDTVCPYGQYGHDCKGTCSCPNDCTCNPIKGTCDFSFNDTTVFKAANCLMAQMEGHQEGQCGWSVIVIIVISCLLAFSIVINISLVCSKCACSGPDGFKLWHKWKYGRVSTSDEDSANEGAGNIKMTSY